MNSGLNMGSVGDQRSEKTLRLSVLDSVRGVAALWVFAYHVWQFGGEPPLHLDSPFGRLNVFAALQHGPAGVDLFMVLSGFCLFWPLVSSGDGRDRWNWKSYAIRRARRILPAYYAAIAYAIVLPVCLVWLVRHLGWAANTQPVPSSWQIVSHALFIHTLFRDTWNGITGAFWSMGLELQFYVVFPLLVWAWKRIGMRAVGLAALASVVYRMACGWLLDGFHSTDQFLWSITFIGRWMQFAAGMVAASWVAHSHGRAGFSIRGDGEDRHGGGTYTGWFAGIPSLGLLLVGSLLVGVGLSETVTSKVNMPWRDMCLAVGYSLLIVGVCVKGAFPGAILKTGALPWFGRISYSFFLIHQPTAWYLMELLRKKLGVSGVPQVVLGLTLGGVFTLAVSYGFYLIFERPFLNEVRVDEGRSQKHAVLAGQDVRRGL